MQLGGDSTTATGGWYKPGLSKANDDETAYVGIFLRSLDEVERMKQGLEAAFAGGGST
jgi:hypothetical protein